MAVNRMSYDPKRNASDIEMLTGTTFEKGSYTHSGYRFSNYGDATVQAVMYDGLIDMTDEVLSAYKSGRLDSEVTRFMATSRHEQQRWWGRTGLDSYETVLKMAGEKWDEGMAVVEKMREEIAKIKLPEPKDVRRRQEWNEEDGDEFSIDRHRNGDAAWRYTPRRTMTGPQIVTIAVNLCCSASVSPQDVLWRGAAAIAMTEVVESRGYQAEIISTTVNRDTVVAGGSMIVGAWVKRAGDALDVANIVNGMSAWYYRTIGFGSWSVAIPGKSKLTYGFGQPGYLNAKAVKLLMPDIDESKVWAIDNGWTFKDAIKIAADCLLTLK